MNQTRRCRESLIRKVVFSAPVALICLLIGQSVPARPATLGLELAVPSQNKPFRGSDSLLDANGPAVALLTLTIDTSGIVTAVAPNDVMTMVRMARLQNYFSGVKLLPARRNGAVVTSRLAVEAVLSSTDETCDIRYPIGVDSTPKDQFLYTQSLILNGLTPASWKTFPWFHAGVHSTDSAYLAKYALISVGLSSKGRVTRAELIGTNYPGFAEQVTSAVKYGSYLPAKLGRKSLSSDNFLLITFFPSISYPTKPLVSSNLDSVSWHARYLVRMMLDSVGMMSAPIPRQPSPPDLQMVVPKGLAHRTVLMACAVDTLGKAKLTPMGIDTAGVTDICRRIGDQIRFYPAMDFQGRPHSFNGIAQVANRSEGIIRIRYLWLK